MSLKVGICPLWHSTLAQAAHIHIAHHNVWDDIHHPKDRDVSLKVGMCPSWHSILAQAAHIHIPHHNVWDDIYHPKDRDVSLTNTGLINKYYLTLSYSTHTSKYMWPSGWGWG